MLHFYTKNADKSQQIPLLKMTFYKPRSGYKLSHLRRPWRQIFPEISEKSSRRARARPHPCHSVQRKQHTQSWINPEPCVCRICCKAAISTRCSAKRRTRRPTELIAQPPHRIDAEQWRCSAILGNHGYEACLRFTIAPTPAVTHVCNCAAVRRPPVTVHCLDLAGLRPKAAP